MIVTEINGAWFVVEIAAGPFDSNADAWRHVDRIDNEPNYPKQRYRRDEKTENQR
jgi:hypothetical protein